LLLYLENLSGISMARDESGYQVIILVYYQPGPLATAALKYGGE
jgi:hypothetical protein